MLREQGISWIAVGEECIDLNRAMETLYCRFHVRRLPCWAEGISTAASSRPG